MLLRHVSRLTASPCSVINTKRLRIRRCFVKAAVARRRTQSILLDDPNPIIHAERYKLHKNRKAHNVDEPGHAATAASPAGYAVKVEEWEANPYRG